MYHVRITELLENIWCLNALVIFAIDLLLDIYIQFKFMPSKDNGNITKGIFLQIKNNLLNN